MSKGKYAKITGEQNGNTRLTADIVREIRDLHVQGASAAALSKAYGLSKCAMRELLDHRSWRNVV